MMRLVLSTAVITGLALAGCASESPPPPVKTGFLSTNRNLVQIDHNSWRYLDPNNRLARYNKFIVDPVTVAFPEGSKGMDTSYGDVQLACNYMRDTIVETLSRKYEVVDNAAGDVAKVKIALTDAYDAGGRVGVAMEGELVDSVSDVQIGALVESQIGKNLTINRFWTEKDATRIMDDWANRLLDAIDAAHAKNG